MGRRWLLAIVAAAWAVLSPPGAHAITLLGDPPFLSPGEVRSLPFTMFGEQVTPRLDVNGFLRYQTVAFGTEGVDDDTLLMTPELNLDINLKLTASQRIHVVYNTAWQLFIDPEERTRRVEDAEPARAWYEGQPFNWLTPRDSFPLDIDVAGGRLPLILHNGLWFNNDFDGFAISKKNIQAGNLSNLNLIYFLTRGQTRGGQTAAGRREVRKNVTGVVAFADWLENFFEISWALSYDNDRTAQFPDDINRNFWGISVTRQIGTAGVSLRALGNASNDSLRDRGELYVLESEKHFKKFSGYANVFGGTSDWLPVSVSGAPLNRLGLLFTTDRLTPGFPVLTPSGNDSVGGVLGVILNPRGVITFVPEFGWLIDNSDQDNDQFGGGLQIQADLASLLIPGKVALPRLAAETRRRGLLYGLLARLTIIGIPDPGPSRGDFGARLELIYRF